MPTEGVAELRRHLPQNVAGDFFVDDSCIDGDTCRQILEHRFEWVLPGHGRIHHASPPAMRAHLRRCIDDMTAAPVDATG